MSKNLGTVEEGSDLRKRAKLMMEKGISMLIIVDSRNNLRWIFTIISRVYTYVASFAGEHLVGEFMTKRVLTGSRQRCKNELHISP
jgi:predicted transcriptional regulator